MRHAARLAVPAALLAGVALLAALLPPGLFDAGLARAIPYLLAGVGVALCFRAGVINIGAEGQIAAGGLGAAAASLHLPAGLVGLSLALAAAAAAGLLWAALATVLHLAFRVHEVLATLLTNFIALLMLQLCLAGPLGEPGAGFLETPPLPRGDHLPGLAALVLALAAGALGSLLLWRTPFGFGLRILGASRDAARYAGHRPAFLVAAVMLLAGALAGVAGAAELLAHHRRLVEGFSLGFGFRAVTVALLGFLEPLAVIPAALFVGLLEAGAQSVQRQAGVPSALVTAFEGAAVLAVLAITARRMARPC